MATSGGQARLALWSSLFVPFGRATGCRVIEIVAPDLLTALRAQVLGDRPAWDVLALDAALTPGLAADGLLTRFADADPLTTPALTHGVAVFTDALACAYRRGAYPMLAPTSWRDAWDRERFPGLRALPQAAPGLLEAALLADGVAPSALYPLDLSRALAALTRPRPAVSIWWAKPDQPGDALHRGEVDLAVARLGDLRAALAAGADAVIAPPPPLLLTTALVIPQSAPNRDVARDFLHFALQPEVQVALGQRGYIPASPSALDRLSPDARRRLPTARPNSVPLDLAWWHDHGRDASALIAQWLTER